MRSAPGSTVQPVEQARRLTDELDTEQNRKKLLDAYAEELSMKRLEWQNIQVSVVLLEALQFSVAVLGLWLLSSR